MKPKPLKLDLGGLKGQHPGYITVNVTSTVKGQEMGHDIHHDLNLFPYPFKTSSADEVLLYGVLEHLDKPLQVMKEIYRICKGGAIIRIMVQANNDIATNPYHLHWFLPEWFINLRPDAFVNQGIDTSVNFRVIWHHYSYGSRRFWKRYQLFVTLGVIK